VVGDETDMAMGLYSGTCGSLTNVLCSDQNVVTASNLIVGNTYYIRVFTYTSTTGQNTTFDICVSTPGDGAICDFAQPFCTGTTYNFPAGVGTGTGEVGPNYGCLSNTPNPVWYYLKVSGAGPIEIYMYGDSAADIDFACWGPFVSPTTPCTAELTAGDDASTHSVAGPSSDYPSANMIDCSYDSQEMEWCYIPNPQIGEYYILLITNYSNQTQNIVFSQSSGSGATDCSIIAPPISDNGPLCEGQTLLLNANDSVAGATYFWTGPNGFSLTTTDPSISIPNVTVANAGAYSLVVYNANDTSDVVYDTVVVHAYPTATIVNNSGTNILTCNQTSINVTTGLGDAYAWSGGATLNMATNTFTAPGTYVVTVTNGGLCASMDSITIIQDTLWPVATINNPGGTTELTCTMPSISVVAGIGDSYAWNGGSTPTTAANTFTMPGVYTVTVTISNGCTATTSITITQQAQVALSLMSMVPDHCAQGMGEATVTASGGSGNYIFTWDGTEIPQESAGVDHATHLYAGNYSVDVADGPCTDHMTVVVGNIPGPIASFEPFPTVVFSSNPEFRFLNKSTNGFNQTTPGYTYSWSFGDGASSVLENPTHLYSGEVADYIVLLEVTDNFGCKDSISQVVSIIEDLKIFIPNSFTPDGDELNDVFKPSGVGYQEKGYEMTIYDRWGKQVFVSNQFDKGWDGTIDGEKVTTSFVFFYRIDIIDLKGSKKKYKGTVTLVGSKSPTR
jgi:gliding motility-associated-like protein